MKSKTTRRFEFVFGPERASRLKKGEVLEIVKIKPWKTYADGSFSSERVWMERVPYTDDRREILDAEAVYRKIMKKRKR